MSPEAKILFWVTYRDEKFNEARISDGPFETREHAEHFAEALLFRHTVADIRIQTAPDQNRFQCIDCGRHAFTQKQSHRCNGRYRKRKLRFRKFVAPIFVAPEPLSAQELEQIQKERPEEGYE